MRAAVAMSQNPTDPLSGLVLTDRPVPEERPGWVRLKVRAASLNPHDTWTLRGVGHSAERLPIVLGCDAAGVTDSGEEVVLHPVIGDSDRGGGDLTLDPKRALMSETIDGTLAEYVLVPRKNVVLKPVALSFAQAASLGVAWGTAYRMLVSRASMKPGDRVLVQGASGGVASAAISIAAAAGARVFATARSEEKRAFARSIGAEQAFEPGARLPERVDIVVESVGEATWAHSLRALRPGGTVVICGATTGSMPPADLSRIFYQQLSVIGSTGCTRAEFEALLRFLEVTGVRPQTESIGFDAIPDGFRRLLDGDVNGKLVVEFEAD